MTREEVFTRLTGIFRDIFDDETISVSGETSAADIDGWDSLTHIALISAVEDEFSMKFQMKEVLSMKNIGEMADIILRSGR